MLLTTNRTYKMYVETLDFDNAIFPRKEVVELEFTNLELLHAIVTCGMPIHHLTTSSVEQRKSDLLQKCRLVEMALDVEGEYLKRSERTYFLDPSEKSVISYYLGMIFTKLISGRVFFLDYLTHITTIQKQTLQKAAWLQACRRSDFIGYRIRHDDWSVWEAKGRIQYSLEALESGYLQAREISLINGQKPKYGAVCMTYYESGNLTAQVKDPEGVGNVELNFLPEHFYQAYYKHICELYQEEQAMPAVADHEAAEEAGGETLLASEADMAVLEADTVSKVTTESKSDTASEAGMNWVDISVTLPRAGCDDVSLSKGNGMVKVLQREEPARTIRIGIPDKIYDAIKNRDGKNAFVTTQEKTLWRSWCPEDIFMGKDGICIRVE